MKKISVFLLGALLIGVASAFTTAPKAVPQIVYGTDGTTWYQVNREDINVTYSCDAGNEFCLFDQPNGSPLPGLTENEKFQLIP
jgi:hypothetical protein